MAQGHLLTAQDGDLIGNLLVRQTDKTGSTR
jgi:hypothetical protein